MTINGLLTLVLFAPFLAIVVVANLAEVRPGARNWTKGLLVVANVLLVVGGPVLSALEAFAQQVLPSAVPAGLKGVSWLPFAIVVVATGLLAFLPLSAAVRKFVARFLPVDPQSPVHMTAMVFAIYQLGINLAQLTIVGNPQTLSSVVQPLSIVDVLLSELPLLLLALLGVGSFVRRNGAQVLERLALRWPTWRQLVLVVGVILLLLALDIAVGYLWQALDPAGLKAEQQATGKLFGGLISVPGALVLGISAGIAEELLFRGAVQPRLGLLAATILFTIGHLEYGFTLALAEIFVLGLILGWVRRGTKNTTVTILIHTCYNAAGVLLSLLKP